MALATLKVLLMYGKMIAALIIFSVLFAMVAIVVFSVFIMDRVTRQAFAWAESTAQRGWPGGQQPAAGRY